MVCPVSDSPGSPTRSNAPDKGTAGGSNDNDQTKMGNNGGGEEKRETGYNRDKPPHDDCCPICFGDFTVPCRTNCGHWFCGSCILQLWEHRSRPCECSCPFCSSKINKLVPDVSEVGKTEAEVVEVLANIELYNILYVEGIKNFCMMLGFYLRKHGPYLLLCMLQALVVAVIYIPVLIKHLLYLLVDLIRHPERERPKLKRVCMMTFTLGLVVYSYCGVLPSGRPPRPKLAKFTMWTEFACITLAFLPYMARFCMYWIRIWCLVSQKKQLEREQLRTQRKREQLRMQQERERLRLDQLETQLERIQLRSEQLRRQFNALGQEVDW